MENGAGGVMPHIVMQNTPVLFGLKFLRGQPADPHPKVFRRVPFSGQEMLRFKLQYDFFFRCCLVRPGETALVATCPTPKIKFLIVPPPFQASAVEIKAELINLTSSVNPVNPVNPPIRINGPHPSSGPSPDEPPPAPSWATHLPFHSSPAPRPPSSLAPDTRTPARRAPA